MRMMRSLSLVTISTLLYVLIFEHLIGRLCWWQFCTTPIWQTVDENFASFKQTKNKKNKKNNTIFHVHPACYCIRTLRRDVVL